MMFIQNSYQLKTDEIPSFHDKTLRNGRALYKILNQIRLIGS
jgi:hypothetical protein